MGHFGSATRDCFRGSASLQIEVMALRHQLHVLERSVKRPKLTASDRFLWACLAATWWSWRSALIMVQPETVIGWHRKGFGWFWAWKVRHGKPGRPAVPKEVRAWIRKMSRENPLWGAPRIDGELLKLGIDIGETSVSKYLVRRHNPPSQTWRTFLGEPREVHGFGRLLYGTDHPVPGASTCCWYWRMRGGAFCILA
jgi:hypothetical protein